MITTKGIIEQVLEDSATNVVQYRVRLPLFHEIAGASETKTNELPLAIYPLPPHMEETRLRVGDIVECTLEDGGLDNVIILGMIPSSQTKNTYGSRETESKISITDLDSVRFGEKGSIILPAEIKIRLNTEDKDLIDSDNYEDRNYLNLDDLICIKGLSIPLVKELARKNEKIGRAHV